MNVTNGIFEVVAGQSFNGIGTLTGNLQADAGSALNPGNVAGNPATGTGTGVLTVSGRATLNGTINFRLNTANVVNADQLAASTYSISGATLLVTNVGPAFSGSNVFHLFSSAVDTNGFVSMTLPTSDSSQSVINNLAVDGTVVIAGLANTTPAGLDYSISGNVLTLAWPADHTGWTLQMQTNDLSSGLGTNWVNVPGSAGVNSTNITVDPATPAVFFRLVSP